MMRQLVIGRDIGPEICEALGLDGSTIQKIVLTIEADRPVVIEVTSHLEGVPPTSVFESVLTRYSLAKMEV